MTATFRYLKELTPKTALMCGEVCHIAIPEECAGRVYKRQYNPETGVLMLIPVDHTLPWGCSEGVPVPWKTTDDDNATYFGTRAAYDDAVETASQGRRGQRKDAQMSKEQVQGRIALPAATAHTRGRQTTINLPQQCRDVSYRRYIMADGRILFVPAACTAGHPENSHGTPVIPKRDGKLTYAPVPADAAGWRYRRIINQTTGVVVLTPVYRPPEKKKQRNGGRTMSPNAGGAGETPLKSEKDNSIVCCLKPRIFSPVEGRR